MSKVVIVTGAGQGIGRAVTQRLLEQNHNVVLADNDLEAAEEAARVYADLPGSALVVQTDVSDEDAVQVMVGEGLKYFGRIDGLVNNAGIGTTKPLTELSLADWRKVIGTNLTGTFLCSKYAAPHLTETAGAVVNIASTRAYMSEPNTEAYAASKGGVIALTHALAVSLGPEVRVNAISPGWIEVGDWQKASERAAVSHREVDKKQHPVGRVGRPEDIAKLVSYLLSDDAGFITGQSFVVDGGMTRKMIYAD